MAEIRTNGVGGLITADLSAGATTFTHANLANLGAVVAPDYAWISLGSEIPSLAAGGVEYVKVTAHTAASTSATIARGQLGTSARAHLFATGESWRHAAMAGDFSSVPVNVKDVVFGAKGDGATDDTVAINLAVAALAALGGGRLFFPKGTYIVSPTSLHILDVVSDMEIFGEGMYLSVIKVKNSAGNFESIFEPPSQTTAIADIYVHDIGLDQNDRGNTVTTTGQLTAGKRNGFRIDKPNNVLWERVRFFDFHSTWLIVCDPTSTYPGENQRVANCVFDQIGGTHYLVADHSSVYLSGAANLVVEGCRGTAVAPGTGDAFTMVEVHGPHRVSNNRCVNYSTFTNLTSIHSAGPTLGSSCYGNWGKGLARGIWIWPYYFGGSNTTGFALDGLDIYGNDFEVDRDTWEPLVSLVAPLLVDHSTSGDAPIRGLQIHHNTLRCKASVTAVNAAVAAFSGIRWVRSSFTPVIDQDVSICDNVILNSLGAGMYFAFDTGYGFKRLRCNDNTIVNPIMGSGSFSDDLRAGIVLVGGEWTDCEMSRNVVIDDRGTHQIVRAAISNAGLHSETGNRSFDNLVRCDDGTVIPTLSGMSNWEVHGPVAYTPTFVAAGGGASLGNGTLTGMSARREYGLVVDCQLTVGSTTNFGTGVTRIGLPVTTSFTENYLGAGYIFDTSASAFYEVVAVAGAGGTYVSLLRDTGQITGTTPITFATGDIIRFSVTLYATT